MGDSVFREKQDVKPAEETKVEVKDASGTPINDHIEVPYTDSRDFLEGYFELGTEWKDRDMIFFEDLNLIDGLIKLKIREGEIPNDSKAVKGMLDGFAKLNNLKNETRSVVKLEVLRNYAEFLMKNYNLKSNLKRYAN
jgi:hypothetical protein